MILVIYFFVISCSCMNAKAQQVCQSGSLYHEIEFANIYPVNIGNWYLNLHLPSPCSGRVLQYEIKFYLQFQGTFNVHIALWKPTEQANIYKIVDSSSAQLPVTYLKKRKKKATIEGKDTIPLTNLYVRRGSVVGVYFEPHKFPLPVIGSLPSGNHEICKQEGTSGTVSINCSSSNLVSNLAIFAEALISPIECDRYSVPHISHGGFTFIDGDFEYGARVRYYCYTGYRRNSIGMLQCDENGKWAGTPPKCERITSCIKLDVLYKGMVIGSDYSIGSSLTFVCNSGYVLRGSSVLTCNKVGIWNDNAPYCSLTPSTINTNSSTNIITGTSSFSVIPSNVIMQTPHSGPTSVSASQSVNRLTNSLEITVGLAVAAALVIMIVTIAVVICVILLILRKSSGNNTIDSDAICNQLSESAVIKSGSCENPMYAEAMDYEQMVPATSVTEESDEYLQLEPDSVHTIRHTSRCSVESIQSRSLIVSTPNPVYESYDEVLQSPDQRLYDYMQHNTTTELFVPNNEQHQQQIIASNSNDNECQASYPTTSKNQNLFDDTGQYSVLRKSREGFFTEEPIYWEPRNDTTSIYEQLAKQKYREIPRHHIKINTHLGSGQFGTVDKGEWITQSGPVVVAVKTLKGFASEEEEIKFLQEAAINGQFHHPNVAELFGITTVGSPMMIILEYAANGDLKHYLENKRPMPEELPDDSLPQTLINFSYQVACGMNYLSEKGFVHRDLAARNILVDASDICKIADFGMSRDLQDKAYYKSNSVTIPVKWTAPEAIHFHKYSTLSDVWSFGAVLYEIWSVGFKPFEKHTNQECIRLVDSGYRLPPPPGCPRSVYELMIMCWNPEPSGRPLFNHLVSELSKTEKLTLQTDQLKAYLGNSIGNQYFNNFPDLQNIYS